MARRRETGNPFNPPDRAESEGELDALPLVAGDESAASCEDPHVLSRCFSRVLVTD